MQHSRPLVLHVTNIPTPYRLPYLRTVSAALAKDGLGYHVFFLGRGKRERNWAIGAEQMFGFEHSRGATARPITEAIALVRSRRPALVVLAWAMDPPALRLLLYCVRHRIPTVLFTGETEGAAAQRSHAWLRRLVRRPFFWLASGFLTYGSASTAYVRGFGVPAGRITTGINVVDTSFFRERVDALRADGTGRAERDRYRTSAGEPFACHLLLVGYMIPGKGITCTLRALALAARPDIALHLVGSGEREAAHRALVDELGLGDRVFFHGYHQTAEMPRFYAMADMVLFPSMVDVFGLVMVEAAAAGLPVIASAYSGGTADVVVHDETGLVVDPRDTAAYAAAILALADDRHRRERMGTAARQRAGELLTPERSAERFAEAVRRLLTV